MESLLLVGSEETALKRLKSHLVKKGFRAAVASSREDLLSEAKERFVLGVVDVSAGQETLADWVSRIRSHPAGKELPLLALISPGQLRDLSSVNGLEDFLITPAPPRAPRGQDPFSPEAL